MRLRTGRFEKLGLCEPRHAEPIKAGDGQFDSEPRIIKEFGGKPAYLGAIRELEQGLYQQAAH